MKHIRAYVHVRMFSVQEEKSRLIKPGGKVPYVAIEVPRIKERIILQNDFRNQVLRPNEKQQLDMLVGGLADLLFKLSEGNEAFFCVPGAKNNFEPSAHYTIDGVTEKVV